MIVAPEQLQWQAQELGVLVCFNLATFLDSDGCEGQMVPDVSLFKPSLLNTDNWAQTMIDFGAQYAVLVAKVRIVRLFFKIACTLPFCLIYNHSMVVVFIWLQLMSNFL